MNKELILTLLLLLISNIDTSLNTINAKNYIIKSNINILEKPYNTILPQKKYNLITFNLDSFFSHNKSAKLQLHYAYMILNETTFNFSKSLIFYVIITFLLTALIILIVKLKNYTAQRLKKNLEKIISEKTQQLTEMNKEITDINSALDAEKEFLETILESIGDGVISTDLEGNIIFANKSAKTILAMNEYELIGAKIKEVFQNIIENHESKAINYFDIQLDENFKTIENKQVIINTKDNKRKILNIKSSVIKNKSGYTQGIVFVLNDKTEIINIETQLALSQKMESIGQLAAGIAHEINTPLQYVGDNVKFLDNAFYSLTDFLKTMKNLISKTDMKEIQEEILKIEKELDLDYLLDEIPNAFEQTHVGIQRVSQIILAMRDFAHPSIKAKSYYDINHGIDVTANICRNKWKYIADLKLELDPNLPPVFCNLDEINQVVLNMILNSIDAIEEKISNVKDEKGLIKISTKQINDEVEITISDTGIGIQKENLKRIFDPFFTTKQVGKGTGQGLSICYNIIVKKHNGKIFVNSTYGEGTTFTIRLPINPKGELVDAI